jgi:hypothetical protein
MEVFMVTTTDAKEPYKWLKKDWQVFFPAVEQAATEEEVRRLCEAELDGWRARPTIKKESSLRNPYTDTTNEAKNRLQGEKLEWVLKYLSFSSAEWTMMNAGSDETIQERHENQQFIRDPDAIVARGTTLLKSEHWPDLAVGIALCTGRRVTEVLKTAELAPKTAYSVLFRGQLKAKGAVEFEIPTLAPAADVLQAVERLRSLVDATDMEKRAVAYKLSQSVREASHRHFVDLIPTKGGIHDELYTHISRSIYAMIAVLYYCPLHVTAMHYMATIQGHYRYLEAKTEQDRRNYASVAHYSDYRILNAEGQIDGRQGIRLGMSGVELLEVFKAKPRKEKKQVTTAQEETKETQGGKNRPISVDGGTFNREMALKAGKGFKTHAETITFLLDFLEANEGKVSQAQAVEQAHLTPEALVGKRVVKLDEEEVLLSALIGEAMNVSGEKQFSSFLMDALTKEAKFRLSLSKRHADKDFASMPTSQLAKTKHPGAAQERIRRAVMAIVKYNDHAQSDNDRWYINPTVVQKLAGSRFPAINAYFAEHQAEIDQENEEYSLSPRYNHKPKSIEQVITLPEEAPKEVPLSALIPES